ncbi:MAG: rod shape-determining protein RodA [Chloroflexia bacterium]|nr:rod shape-determining protein RodA [Chloroflexia bacterium]
MLSDRWRDFDVIFFITMVVLMGFGAIAIWSADGLPPLLSNNEGTRQAALGLIGIGIMLIVAAIDYRFLATLAWPLYFIGIASLGLVLTPLGQELGGAQNWFDVGGFLIQPSEFAKVGTIIALSAFVSSRGEAMREFGNFIVAGLIVALPAGIVLIAPDLGQTMVYVAIWCATMIVAHTRRLFFVILTLLLGPFVWFAWNFVLEPYHRERFQVSFNPEMDPLGTGFQILQARISIGAGGIRGAGLPGGTQSQLDLLSVRSSDFVFAHASGMFGFIGMVGLFIAQIILLWRCLRVAEIARDSFGQCLAVTITGVLFFQAFLNIGMNVGLMPVTGITLPFVSYGVSSLWTFLILAGILQSILMHHRKLDFDRG